MQRPTADERERRAVTGTVEIRKDGSGSGVVSGYAAIFNEETVIGGSMWGFREVIAPGAFTNAVKNDDVRALFNHDANILLGRTASGTLKLVQDKKGLRYEADLPDTQAAQDVRKLIERGDVTGSSFAFVTEEDEWDETPIKKGELPIRTIRKVSLYDVSPVTYPAYEATSVSARSQEFSRTEAMQRRSAEADAAKSPALLAREAARARLEGMKACGK